MKDEHVSGWGISGVCTLLVRITAGEGWHTHPMLQPGSLCSSPTIFIHQSSALPEQEFLPTLLLGAGLILYEQVGPCTQSWAWQRPRELGLPCPSGLAGLCHLCCSQLCLELLQEPRALKKTLLQPQPLFQISQLLPTEAAWLRSPSPLQTEEILVSAPALPEVFGRG